MMMIMMVITKQKMRENKIQRERKEKNEKYVANIKEHIIKNIYIFNIKSELAS